MKRKRQVASEEEDNDARLEKMRQGYINKQHTLIVCSRGVSYRYRHLAKDLNSLMPHSKTDVKVHDKAHLFYINEMCDLKNCTNCLYFEGRRKDDCFLWMARTPDGPSVKFHVTNVHTLEELKFTGNCLKGSRPIVTFDKSFDDPQYPHLMLMKELFSQTFGTPKLHPKSKPFIDHIMLFSYFAGRIWYRNYQIVDEFHPENPKQLKEEKTLIEIGPRFVLNIISIFSGSFRGEMLYRNPEYTSPNEIRREERRKKKDFAQKRLETNITKLHKETWAPEPDLLDDVF